MSRKDDVPLATFEADRRVLRSAYLRVRGWYRRYAAHRWVSIALFPVRETVHALLRWLDYRAEVKYERRLRIHTVNILRFKADPSARKDATYYEATPFGVIEQLLDTLSLTPEDVFVDIGCGKGRVLCMVAVRALKKVIGIDMLPELLDEARRNLQRVQPRTPVEFLEGDATTFDMDEGTIFYMFNPFGEATMTAMLDNIRKSLSRHPRQVRIVYTAPMHAALLDAQDWLAADGEPCSMVRIWRSTLPVAVQEAEGG